jgi:hypothetical protein
MTSEPFVQVSFPPYFAFAIRWSTAILSIFSFVSWLITPIWYRILLQGLQFALYCLRVYIKITQTWWRSYIFSLTFITYCWIRAWVVTIACDAMPHIHTYSPLLIQQCHWKKKRQRDMFELPVEEQNLSTTNKRKCHPANGISSL